MPHRSRPSGLSDQRSATHSADSPGQVFEPVSTEAYFPDEDSFFHGGSRVRYWTYSALKSEPDQPKLVMVHGFRGDHHGLSLIAQTLRSRWEVVVPDLPGFGRSEPLQGVEHTSDAYAAAVQELICHVSSDPVILIGHSFGSVVASRVAAADVNHVAGLTLINPICEPALQSSQRIPAIAASIFYQACAVFPRPLGNALVRSRVITRISSEIMMKSRQAGLRRFINGQHDAYFGAFQSLEVVMQAYRSSIADTVRDAAPRVTCPTLLIAAERDDLGSVEGQQELSRIFPDARLEIIPEVGHLIHYETPRRAAAMIDGFAEEIMEAYS